MWTFFKKTPINHIHKEFLRKTPVSVIHPETHWIIRTPASPKWHGLGLQPNNERNKNERERELLAQMPFGTSLSLWLYDSLSLFIQSQACPTLTDDQTKLMGRDGVTLLLFPLLSQMKGWCNQFCAFVCSVDSCSVSAPPSVPLSLPRPIEIAFLSEKGQGVGQALY